ncbi:MAG: hypothetical protein C0524_11215 [Rhodobacter sp.]|nr:hypothetical protein [Rhodobacter sp.]
MQTQIGFPLLIGPGAIAEALPVAMDVDDQSAVFSALMTETTPALPDGVVPVPVPWAAAVPVAGRVGFPVDEPVAAPQIDAGEIDDPAESLPVGILPDLPAPGAVSDLAPAAPRDGPSITASPVSLHGYQPTPPAVPIAADHFPARPPVESAFTMRSEASGLPPIPAAVPGVIKDTPAPPPNWSALYIADGEPRLAKSMAKPVSDGTALALPTPGGSESVPVAQAGVGTRPTPSPGRTVLAGVAASDPVQRVDLPTVPAAHMQPEAAPASLPPALPSGLVPQPQVRAVQPAVVPAPQMQPEAAPASLPPALPSGLLPQPQVRAVQPAVIAAPHMQPEAVPASLPPALPPALVPQPQVRSVQPAVTVAEAIAAPTGGFPPPPAVLASSPAPGLVPTVAQVPEQAPSAPVAPGLPGQAVATAVRLWQGVFVSDAAPQVIPTGIVEAAAVPPPGPVPPLPLPTMAASPATVPRTGVDMLPALPTADNLPSLEKTGPAPADGWLSLSAPIANPLTGPAPTVTNVQPAIPQLAARIVETLVHRADGTTELALSPDELGRVRVSLQADAQNPDRMVVMLSFDRPETLDLFRRHADQLADALRAAGYSGADIGFGHSGTGTSRGEADAAPGDRSGALHGPDTPETVAPPRRLAATTSLDLRL